MIAVLGAGAGSRLGGDKLNRDLAGKPVGRWALDTALELGNPVRVIARSQSSAWIDSTNQLVTVIANPEASTGMASSLRLAAQAAITDGCPHLLILLADMPFVRADTLRGLINHTAASSVTACLYDDGRLGPPACFGHERMHDLLSLQGDVGARSLLNRKGFAAPLRVESGELMDIDTQGELGAAAFRLGAAG